jgi:hypothetical protein
MTAKTWSRVLAVFLLIGIFASCAMAQSKAAGSKYDPSKEVKLKGTVAEVKESANAGDATVIVVKTADKTTLVQLAPAEFLKEIDCWIKPGDTVEVVGAKVPDAADAVLAREVVFGNNTMVLRDQKGVPVWEVWKPSKPGM